MPQTRLSPTANQTLASDPDCDVIDALFTGFAQFMVLDNALNTDIFDHVEQEATAVSVATLSTKHGYNPDVLERLLDNLTCMKLVKKCTDDNGNYNYSNSRAASVYLSKSSSLYKGDTIQIDRLLVEKTSSGLGHTLMAGPRNQMEALFDSHKMTNANNNVITLKKDTSNSDNSDENQNTGVESSNPLTDNNSVLNTTNNNNNWVNKMTTPTHVDSGLGEKTQSKLSIKGMMKSMDAMMYPVRHVIPKTFDLSGHRSAVDLGGGTGYMAQILTDYYPQLSATVFELPHVVAVSRPALESRNLNGRVSFMAGNFFQDDLPVADLYILSRVIHDWNEARINILLDKVYSSLPPGGKLLILEKFLNDRKDGPGYIMNIHLIMSSIGQGRERSASEYESLVEAHGFVDTRCSVISGVNLFDALLTCKPF